MINRMLVFLALIFVGSVIARDTQETFLKANKCYQNKQYQEAFELYQSIKNKGSATFCNMGNCSFKLNNYLDALVYWRKAQKNASMREVDDIAKNIETVYQVLGKKPEGFSLKIFLNNIINGFSTLSFQILFLVFWFLFALGIWFFKKMRVILFTTILPLNIIFGGLLFIKYQSNLYSSAIAKETVSLFSGPDKNFHSVGQIDKADELLLVQKQGDWCKVKANRLSGWILTDKIEII